MGVALSICTDAPYAASKGCLDQRGIVNSRALRPRSRQRFVPHGGEGIRFGIEAGDSGAGALRSVRIEERKIRLQRLAVLDHILLTTCRLLVTLHRLTFPFPFRPRK